MFREDYEIKFTTLKQPFEIGVLNKNQRIRSSEIDIDQLKTDKIFPYRMIIRFNSTYLETMDHWEYIRGRATGLALPMWAVCISFVILEIYASITVFFKNEYLYSFLFLLLSLPFAWLIYTYYRISKYDLFGYTHYPIRFNRKTQKVYAFSPQQNKVVELDWKVLRFSTVLEHSEIELRASKVNEENIVEEEIIFPYRIPEDKPELAEEHLAFFKAYMQSDDLEKIDKSITEFYDVYNRKESFRESFERVYIQYDLEEMRRAERPEQRDIDLALLGVALWVSQLLLKRLGLIFSKIPQWPSHIEDECRIDENDPYDSTGKQRHLAPLSFTTKQIVLLTLSGLFSFGLLLTFLIGLAVFSLNNW